MLAIGISVQIGHRKSISARENIRSRKHWIKWGAALIWLWECRLGIVGSSSMGEVKQRHPFEMTQAKGIRLSHRHGVGSRHSKPSEAQ